MHFQGRQWEQYLEKKQIIFSQFVSGRNSANPDAICFVPGASRFSVFFFKILLSKAGGIVVASSFTSLFVVCEWAEPWFLNHFFVKTWVLLSASARKKWIYYSEKNQKGESSKSAGKTDKVMQKGQLVI